MDILRTANEMKVAVLMGALVEAFLEAINTIAFIAFMLHSRKHSKKTNWPICIASTLLYSLVTTHWAIGIVMLKRAFISHGSTYFGPILYYSDFNSPIQMARLVLYAGCTITIDLLLIYRLFVLFERKLWIVIPPLLCLVAMIVCIVKVLVLYAHVESFADVLLSSPIGALTISLYGLSLVSSFYPSALIAYQIITKHMYGTRNISTRRVFLPVVYTIVESALFYFIINCTILALYLKQSGYVLFFLGVNPQFISINFSLIALRISILSAQRRKRMSQAALSRRTSQTSFAPSQILKIGVADDISLRTLAQEQWQQQQQLSRRSKTSLPVASSKDSLSPNAAYGVAKPLSSPNSNYFGASSPGSESVVGSPTRSETLFSISPSGAASILSNPTKVYTPSVDPRW